VRRWSLRERQGVSAVENGGRDEKERERESFQDATLVVEDLEATL
jgi:hypothetical protein